MKFISENMIPVYPLGDYKVRPEIADISSKEKNMETSIIISGFGGQGTLFAGQVLAYAALDSGKSVT